MDRTQCSVYITALLQQNSFRYASTGRLAPLAISGTGLFVLKLILKEKDSEDF